MIFALIGLIVGLLMGVTGAGGAVVAIPLFQLLLNASLKEATVLSLITVLLGTSANLTGRMKEVNWKLSAGLSLSGALSNFLSMPLKRIMPEEIITLLLILIGTFSIWSVWSSSQSRSISGLKKVNPTFIIFTGLVLGLVATLTGLGGGVLLIPILLRIFGMSYEAALPTSLASIFLVSLSSIIIQGNTTVQLITASDVGLIAAGSIMAFVALKLSLRLLDEGQKLKLRKYVFTVATICSLLIVAAKSL